MYPFTTEDIALDARPRPFWQALRELATSAAVVGAIALIGALLGASTAHARAGHPTHIV